MSITSTSDSDSNKDVVTSENFDKLVEACASGKSLMIAACLIELSRNRHSKLLTKQHQSNGEVMSPFLIVVRNGHVAAADLLLRLFAVDPNDVAHRGVISFDGVFVHGATPLWCASGIGCFKMVQLLVEYGANINDCTMASSTPLRAACFHGDLTIVKYLLDNGADMNITNHYNNSCLMVAAYRGKTDIISFLLDKGADPNVQAVCGGTALHYAVEGQQLEAIEILCGHGALISIKNKDGLTAPMLASDCCRSKMVEYFSSLPNVQSIDKITWLELLGASFANNRDSQNIAYTYNYLYLAMLYRNQGQLPKKVLAPIAAYDYRKECTTIEQLNDIQHDEDTMYMEALIVRERTLGPNNLQLCHPIVYRGAVYADSLQFARGISLWQHAIDIKQNNKEMTNSDLLRFAEVFSQMLLLREEIGIPALHNVVISCYKELLSAIAKVNDFKSRKVQRTDEAKLPLNLLCPHKESLSVVQAQLEGVVHAMLYLLYIVTKTVTDDKEMFAFEKIAYDFIKLNVSDMDGRTPLHLVVDESTPVDDFHVRDVCFFPNVQLTNLLLRCGADPNAKSADGNTPLHIIVQYHKPISDFWSLHTIIMKLLEHGAHPDTRNNDRQEPFDIAATGVAEIIIKTESRKSLQCMAASVVRKLNIPYKHVLSERLVKFVNIH